MPKSELPSVSIDRSLFLKVRCAYIRTMVARGDSVSEAIDAVNIHDETQVQLIAMTDPRFDDGTVEREIAALCELSGLTPAADALAKELAAVAANTLASQRDALQRERDDALFALKETQSEAERLQRELAQERAGRVRADAVAQAAVDWQKDTGGCHFCEFDGDRDFFKSHADDCPLVAEGFITAKGHARGRRHECFAKGPLVATHFGSLPPELSATPKRRKKPRGPKR